MVKVHRAKVVKDEIVEKNLRFLAVYLETRNACIALLSEDEDRLGTLVAAVPPTRGMIGPPTSSTLLGDRYTTLARIMAEKLALKKGKIAIVSVYLKTMNESEAAAILLKLIERVTSEKEEKNQTGGQAEETPT